MVAWKGEGNGEEGGVEKPIRKETNKWKEESKKSTKPGKDGSGGWKGLWGGCQRENQFLGSSAFSQVIAQPVLLVQAVTPSVGLKFDHLAAAFLLLSMRITAWRGANPGTGRQVGHWEVWAEWLRKPSSAQRHSWCSLFVPREDVIDHCWPGRDNKGQRAGHSWLIPASRASSPFWGEKNRRENVKEIRNKAQFTAIREFGIGRRFSARLLT